MLAGFTLGCCLWEMLGDWRLEEKNSQGSFCTSLLAWVDFYSPLLQLLSFAWQATASVAPELLTTIFACVLLVKKQEQIPAVPHLRVEFPSSLVPPMLEPSLYTRHLNI